MNDDAISLRQLQAEVGEWSRRNFPNNTPVHPLLGLGEEVGELMHWNLKEMQGIRHTTAETQAGKIDSVADLMIYLADYCERSQIDMQAALYTTWQRVRQRNWQASPMDAARVAGAPPVQMD